MWFTVASSTIVARVCSTSLTVNSPARWSAQICSRSGVVMGVLRLNLVTDRVCRRPDALVGPQQPFGLPAQLGRVDAQRDQELNRLAVRFLHQGQQQMALVYVGQPR